MFTMYPLASQVTATTSIRTEDNFSKSPLALTSSFNQDGFGVIRNELI